ncbi:unnamed protein product, partial [Polarella glacialis]
MASTMHLGAHQSVRNNNNNCPAVRRRFLCRLSMAAVSVAILARQYASPNMRFAECSADSNTNNNDNNSSNNNDECWCTLRSSSSGPRQRCDFPRLRQQRQQQQQQQQQQRQHQQLLVPRPSFRALSARTALAASSPSQQQQQQQQQQEQQQLPEAGLQLQWGAPWHPVKEPEFAEWLGDEVLALPVGDPSLALRLGLACLTFASRGGGHNKSNIGGFHSNDLSRMGAVDPALDQFLHALHEPLAAFLRRRLAGKLPPGVRDKGGALHVSAVLENLWANVNQPGHYNDKHNHGTPTSSIVATGVYYPMTTEAWGEPTSAAKLRLFPNTGSPIEVTPRAGLLLVFPTELIHETEPVPVGEPGRTSLAFNIRIRWLDRPLARAAAAGDVAQVQRLIAEGADVEAVDLVQGLRAAHHAAENGQGAALQALEAAGANLSALSFEGWSPLGLAFDRGHVAVVRHLAGTEAEAAARLQGGPGYP